MFKKSLKSVFLSTLILGSVALADDSNSKDIIIDSSSETGMSIVKSNEEYINNLANTEKEKALLLQHDCDINMLKKAVGKLIEQVESLKTEKVLVLRKESKDVPGSIISNQQSVKDMNELVVDKKTCKKVQVKVKRKYTISQIDGSFVKYDKPKKFKIAMDRVFLYDKPMLDFKKRNNVFKRGQEITVDMYTLAGWVHVKDRGWVKGYTLYPKVMQRNSAPQYKTIEKCD